MVTDQQCFFIDAVELTTWYYWRWTIECYFKLLKQAGHDVESWLQTTPAAILRRLLISSMACVLTWRIQRLLSEYSIEELNEIATIALGT